MDQAEKTIENRLRLKLRRMGYRLEKNRIRDPQAYNYGGYMVIDGWRNFVVAGSHPCSFAMTLEDVEDWIKEAEPNKPTAKPKAKKRR
jgi:hypothetical protein